MFTFVGFAIFPLDGMTSRKSGQASSTRANQNGSAKFESRANSETNLVWIGCTSQAQ